MLDLSGYIAGAYGPRLLADLGADVIKVESPEGDPFRSLPSGFLAWNRGKRGLVVDLKRPAGRDLAHRLIAWADMVVENFRPGVAARLGVDYQTARAINPAIIYCSVPAYGLTGPSAGKPGFDPLLQARSGAMAKQGGAGHSPVFLRLAISDYSAGTLNAIGVLAALYHRDRTGEGQHLETSLTNSCLAVQASDFIEYSGRPPRLDGGPEIPGPAALNRLYQTADGWIHLGCRQAEDWQALGACLPAGESPVLDEAGLDHALATRDEWTEQALGRIFRSRSTGEWLAALRKDGVPAAEVTPMGRVLADPQTAANWRRAEHDHPSFGRLRQIGAFVHFSEAAEPPHRPAPELGEHTDEILAELGLTPDEVARLREAKAVR